jgi:uncharacterized protein YoxC
MENVLLVMQIVALAAVSALCIYLIVVLVRVKSLLQRIEVDVKEISARALPVLDNLEVITDKVKLIAEGISEQVESVRYSIGSVKEIADNIVSFERKVQERIEEPIMDTIAAFASIFKGIQNLIERLPFLSRLRAD